MSHMRPARSGHTVRARPFLRATTAPKAALVLAAAPPPSDWPVLGGGRASDTGLDHALGWTAQLHADGLHLLNPLGEGVYRAELSTLPDGWLAALRADASIAVYVVSSVAGESAEGIVDAAAHAGPIAAATVRAGVGDDYGRGKRVGRNEPCPCGSGRKYKHCHLE